MFFFYLGASTSTTFPFAQDPVYPPADVPSTLHRDNWRTIRTRQSRGNQVQDWYNYRLKSLNMGELVGDVERKFQDHTPVFKLNLSFGFVPFNNEMESTSYPGSFHDALDLPGGKDPGIVRSRVPTKISCPWGGR